MNFEEQMQRIMYLTIRMTTDKMTVEELSAMYLCAIQGIDPAGRLGYDKAKVLFTEADGKRMTRETLTLMDRIIIERLKPKEGD